jgi:hypothetical protein
MHRTKITAFIALITASAFLLFLSSSPLVDGRSVKRAPSDPQSVTAKFLNIGGLTFQPGQVLNVKWLLEGDGVRYFETNPWSECELFFSTDGGRTWSRISPQLSVTRRDFDWFVPNVSTQAGILALHVGIEGDGEYYSFRSAPFSVLAPWDPTSGAF